ncbi:MAG: hypothetical protein ACTSSG_10435 [Candidatus Heimdallarchaeaceae archaeon]
MVKFSSNETRYSKEIQNYEIMSQVAERLQGIYIPKLVYKSTNNKAIIYEGISGKSFREVQLDKNFKHKLAGRTLAAIHGKKTKNFDIDVYKKLILYLLSVLGDQSLEEQLVDLMVPCFLSMEKSIGSTMIHGDFHQGNLLFASDIDAFDDKKLENLPPKIKVYILDPEFIMFGRDRAEDIGTFFAKPCIREFKKYQTINETIKNYKAFLEGYNEGLQSLNVNFILQDLYPDGLTVDFHISSYLLYTINVKISEKELRLDSNEVKENIDLLFYLLKNKPFMG